MFFCRINVTPLRKLSTSPLRISAGIFWRLFIFSGWCLFYNSHILLPWHYSFEQCAIVMKKHSIWHRLCMEDDFLISLALTTLSVTDVAYKNIQVRLTYSITYWMYYSCAIYTFTRLAPQTLCVWKYGARSKISNLFESAFSQSYLFRKTIFNQVWYLMYIFLRC